jgi:hypothetical protein
VGADDREEDPDQDRLLKTAGEAIGLLAGAVAAVYLLGGLIYALRLGFDGFDIEAIVSVLGQLPRETLITAGLVEGIGPAVLVGLLAALGSGLVRRPKPRGAERPGRWPASLWPAVWNRQEAQSNEDLDRLTTGPKPFWFFVFWILLASALVTPAVVLAIETEELSVDFITAPIGWSVTFSVVLAGWYALRKIGRTDWARLWRALAAGGVWAGMALTPAVMFGAAVVLEPTRVCVRDADEHQTGDLIAETKERLLLATGIGDERAVLSLPTARVRRVEYGELSDSPAACPAADPQG